MFNWTEKLRSDENCLPEPHQWKVSSIGHGWSLAMASPSVLVPCPTWDHSDHTLLQLPIWSICNLPNLILRIDASSIILIWLLAWSFQMISLKSSTIARNFSWYFPQNGGFLKWWEPPHHPKLDHFCIEIHGDLGIAGPAGKPRSARQQTHGNASAPSGCLQWRPWSQLLSRKNGEFDQQSLDKPISVCFPRTGKLNWTIVDLGWYGFSLAIPLLGPWTKRCEPYQTPSFVHTKLWFHLGTKGPFDLWKAPGAKPNQYKPYPMFPLRDTQGSKISKSSWGCATLTCWQRYPLAIELGNEEWIPQFWTGKYRNATRKARRLIIL